jgi:polyisoprenoid-binding protein YceI
MGELDVVTGAFSYTGKYIARWLVTASRTVLTRPVISSCCKTDVRQIFVATIIVYTHQSRGERRRIVKEAGTMTTTLETPKVSTKVWDIDPAHSSAQFSVKHMMIANVKGEFSKVSGRVNFDPENPEASSVEAAVDVSSISTREPDRDAHLKSADFFDVAKFSTMTFKSKRVVKNSDASLQLVGDLTIHGVTRETALTLEGPTAPLKDPWGNVRRGASATARINRKDFGLTWNAALEAGGVLVGDEVKITLDVELVQKGAPAAGGKN